jgi:DNA-binding response OmpR family regulator
VITRTVVVAEDDPSMRNLLHETLEQAGWKVLAYSDGAAAWTEIERGSAQLAVLDLNLPKLDGLQVCRRIRNDPKLSVAVLMLTVRSGVDDQLDGYGAGADDYLAKPFAPELLVARLKTLERRVLDRQL